MRVIESCPACHSADRTIVMEYNGLVLLDSMRPSPLCRYDYALCHTCGIVYASKRPHGDELDFLYSRFDEFLGRTERRAGPLSPEEQADLRRRARGGWLVSEENEPPASEWVPEVLAKRLTSSHHINIVASLTNLAGARVLELRSTTGFMLDICRKYLGAAEVFAMPMRPRDELLIQELNPMPSALLDFDTLDVPFEGQFDLILARHMFTHMLYPDRLWQLFHQRLRPGGRVYMYLENDDASMFARRKNLVGEMKCFHFQNADLPSMARALRYQQMEPEFIRHPFGLKSSELVCMARYDPSVRGTPIPSADLRRRAAMYDKWRTLSLLASPQPVQALYGTAMEAMIDRALDAAYVRRDKHDRLVPDTKFKTMQSEGYEALNEAAAGQSEGGVD